MIQVDARNYQQGKVGIEVTPISESHQASQKIPQHKWVHKEAHMYISKMKRDGLYHNKMPIRVGEKNL